MARGLGTAVVRSAHKRPCRFAAPLLRGRRLQALARRPFLPHPRQNARTRYRSPRPAGMVVLRSRQPRRPALCRPDV